MRAWKISSIYCDYQIIVFAETRSKAKMVGFNNEIFDGCEYIEIDANRTKDFDNLEHLGNPIPFCDNAQLFRDKGWHCNDIIYCENECVMKDNEEDK